MSGGFDFSKMREGFDDMMAGAEKSFNDMFNQKSSKMSYDEMVEYCRDDESVGCDLEMLDKAIEMGIDPFPPPKPKRPRARYAIASFLSIMMISWVSKFLMRFT